MIYPWLLLVFLSVASAQLSFDAIGETNTFCDTGPDAMTNALTSLTGGRPIPRYCVPNPIDGGKQRCYYLFVPACASGAVPLLMDMHGGSSCPLWSVFFDGWLQLSSQKCFALFYPIGVTDAQVTDHPCFSVPGGRNVNGMFTTTDCCCTKNNRRIASTETQDMVVVHRMVKDIYFEKRVEGLSNGTASVDATRIYMSGHSNGCLGALGMGAFFSDMVASVCCHAAGAFTGFPPHYSAVPTWIAQGIKDDRIWYQFARETYNTYGWHHQCQNETSVGIDNGTAVEYTHYNCTNDANVTLLLLNESGHIPFAKGFEVTEDASPTTLDTTAMAWEFCSSYSKESIPRTLMNPSAAVSTFSQWERFTLSLLLGWVSSILSR
mmetsp:Transcript_19186/g.31844  ORF Transcript_19186/g.31844 Transcript_19186/m.31844 type:complete len:378 (-) Transcript_19186:84-1217(-)